MLSKGILADRPGAGRRTAASESAPLLSVVIPVRDEEERVAAAVEPWTAWLDTEVIVAIDAATQDKSADRAREVPRVRVVQGPARGRGAVMSAGAMAARGRTLLFHHADSRLARSAVDEALDRIEAGAIAVAFRIRLDSPRPVYRLLEAGINLRSRLLRLPYGDQSLLLPREVFEKAGGFRPLPRCEDVDLVLRLRRLGRVEIARGLCVTSTRRWDREGIVRVTFFNLRTLVRFFLKGNVCHETIAHPDRCRVDCRRSAVVSPAERARLP